MPGCLFGLTARPRSAPPLGERLELLLSPEKVRLRRLQLMTQAALSIQCMWRRALAARRLQQLKRQRALKTFRTAALVETFIVRYRHRRESRRRRHAGLRIHRLIMAVSQSAMQC